MYRGFSVAPSVNHAEFASVSVCLCVSVCVVISQCRQRRHFVVYVMLPQGFGGDIATGGDQAIKAIMYFNYR